MTKQRFNVKNMLHILPFFEVMSINIRRHHSTRQPACIFFPFRFVPPYGGRMEIKMIKTYKNKIPHIGKDVFIAENAFIIGDAEIDNGCSIWFGAVIRADEDKIIIGKNTNIQDNCTLHVDKNKPVIIGENVTVGHNAVVHGCEIGDCSLIGMNSTILDGAKIGKNCVVGAGAVVTQNKTFPDNSLIMGIPAKAVGIVDFAARESILLNAGHYAQKAKEYTV